MPTFTTSRGRLRRAGAIAGALVGAALIAAPSTLANGVPGTSATGHGTLETGDGKRQFSFNAITQKDGVVRGHITVKNPALDVRAYIDVSCLQVVGNRATLGGTVERSNDPGIPPGSVAVATVVDNGEPGRGVDTISFVFVDLVATPEACHLLAANALDPQVPIEGGNIQVRVR